MGWIVQGLLLRAYGLLGTYLASEWRECGERLGLRFYFSDREGIPPAVLIGKTIVIRKRMNAYLTAWWAWHEIAHYLMHAGNLLKPTGQHDPAKQERQANEFAALFPVWDVPDVTFETEPKRVVTWDVESERRYLGCLWGGGA